MSRKEPTSTWLAEWLKKRGQLRHSLLFEKKHTYQEEQELTGLDPWGAGAPFPSIMEVNKGFGSLPPSERHLVCFMIVKRVVAFCFPNGSCLVLSVGPCVCHRLLLLGLLRLDLKEFE